MTMWNEEGSRASLLLVKIDSYREVSGMWYSNSSKSVSTIWFSAGFATRDLLVWDTTNFASEPLTVERRSRKGCYAKREQSVSKGRTRANHGARRLI